MMKTMCHCLNDFTHNSAAANANTSDDATIVDAPFEKGGNNSAGTVLRLGGGIMVGTGVGFGVG